MTDLELEQLLPIVERSRQRMRRRLAETDDGEHIEFRKLIDELEYLRQQLLTEHQRRQKLPKASE